MSSLDLTAPAWSLWIGFRTGFAEYATANPRSLLLFATIPRGAIQIVFFTLLGEVFAGVDHRERAFVGAIALTLCISNVSGSANVPLADKEHGTFWRVRTSRTPVALSLLARALPYPLVGMALVVVQTVGAAALLGEWDLLPEILAMWWVYALIALNFSILVLAAATLSIGHRADVLAPNILIYTVMLFSGAVVPPGSATWIDAVGTVVPVSHALAAVEASRSGQAWLPSALAEAVVGLGCLALLFAASWWQVRRMRRLDRDDFA